jgi:hypothetical protein
VVAPETLLARLASALARAPITETISGRLCIAVRDVAGADAASMTVSYDEDYRVTVCSTDALSARLEDLQDVVGEGPGHTALASGAAQVCSLAAEPAEQWANFVMAARPLVDDVLIHAVPMRIDEHVIGVLTFYQSTSLPEGLALNDASLMRLAAASGVALIRDPTALDAELVDGSWDSRAKIHQATGMVVAQLRVSAQDAIALLRAHAYAGEVALGEIAARVLDRSLRFRP